MRILKLGVVFLVSTLFITACSCSKKFTVEFDSNGGTRVESQTVSKGDSATKPKNPTREGYTFKGWYLDLETKDEYDFSDEVKEDIILTAKWVKKDSSKTEEPKTDSKNETEINSVSSSNNSSSISNSSSKNSSASSSNSNSSKAEESTETKEDVVTYMKDNNLGSALNQIKIYLIKNNNKVSGIADIVTTYGTTIKDVQITKEEGYLTNDGSVKDVINIRLTEN